MTAEPAGARRLAEQLAERLDARPMVGGAAVVGWRFDLSGGWNLRVGVKDGRLGGPYEPPAARRGTVGGIYLRWSDGACTFGNLDARSLADLDERLVEWRASAYQDPEAAEILPPAPLPAVETNDPAVAALVDGEPAALLGWIKQARARLAADGLERFNADAGASYTWRYVSSSTGLRVTYPESSALLYLSADDLYWRSIGGRALPRPEQLAELADDVARATLVLRQAAEAPRGELPVLLAPSLAMSCVGGFLVGNLSGASLVAGRSAFTLDDFAAARQVVRDDLSVTVDTTLALERAASPVSSEGVPGGVATLVEQGRLVRPLVGLKYAARTGYPPTPVPGGEPSFLLRGIDDSQAVEAVRASLTASLELHAVLGLRGQDAVSGRYSLVAPEATVWADGRPIGRAKAALNGNFLEHLRDPRTQLVEYPWGRNPGLLIWTRVEPQG